MHNAAPRGTQKSEVQYQRHHCMYMPFHTCLRARFLDFSVLSLPL